MKIKNFFIILVLLSGFNSVLLFADDHKQKSDSQAVAELCKPHKLKKSECFMCDKSLRTKGRLWCKEHSRYEDRCWLCHPDMKDTKRMWCKEHNLYEDECFFCHPEVKAVKEKPSEKTCAKHNIDEKTCYMCDKSLRTKGRLWCKEHDRYEDRCWKCHPDIEDKNRPFCNEHFLYEDECIFCNPEVKSKEKKKSVDASKAKDVLICNEHRVPEHQCGICQPQLARDLNSGQSMKIRFASMDSVKKAGVRTERPKVSLSSPYVEAYCQIRYNKNKYAKISPLASGILIKVLAQVGQKVREGDVLAEIQSNKIAEAKADYLASIVDHQFKEKTYQREKELNKEKISSLRELQESEAKFKKALFLKKITKQKLINYGFTSTHIEKIIHNHDSSSLMKIIAPFNGTIIERDAVMGEAIESGDALFALADLSEMWLELTISSDLANQIQSGFDVSARFQEIPTEEIEGKLVWVDTEINENSRTIKARAVISNKKGKLKSGMFGLAKVMIENPKQALRVPRESIHQMERESYVFVKVEDDLYDMRKIKIGNKSKSSVHIVSGINENEDIVVAGTFTMVSEYFKSRLGAGCVDD